MKIKKEELDEILAQRDKISILENNISAMEMRKLEFVEEYRKVLDEASETKKKLEKNYGSVSIDLSDGSYTVNKNVEGQSNQED